MKVKLKSCPYCNSTNIYAHSQYGIDLTSCYVAWHFIDCMSCGFCLKSKNINKLILAWNNYDKSSKK